MMMHASSTIPNKTINGPLGVIDILCSKLQLIHVLAIGSTTTRYVCSKVITMFLHNKHRSQSNKPA
jgi:hypothetical protein